MDGECLALTYRTAAQHPPKQDTFHTRITTIAGEVPPAPPTSVLYGEMAAVLDVSVSTCVYVCAHHMLFSQALK